MESNNKVYFDGKCFSNELFEGSSSSLHRPFGGKRGKRNRDGISEFV